MFNDITVSMIASLFLQVSNVRIYMDGQTWEFECDDLPEEISEMKVRSIDNPELALHPTALTLNLDENDMKYEEWKAFKETYSDYLV